MNGMKITLITPASGQTMIQRGEIVMASHAGYLEVPFRSFRFA